MGRPWLREAERNLPGEAATLADRIREMQVCPTCECVAWGLVACLRCGSVLDRVEGGRDARYAAALRALRLEQAQRRGNARLVRSRP